MPLVGEARVLQGPNETPSLDRICKAIGAKPDQFMGYVLLLVPFDPTREMVHIHTDGPDQKTIGEVLQKVANAVNGTEPDDE